MEGLTTAQTDLLAKTNFKVAELISKELGIGLGTMMTTHKSECSFILAAIQSMIMNKKE